MQSSPCENVCGGVVAYFSMEIALNPAIPTYSGGLGILSGDTLRSAADLGVAMVAFTLVHRRGYFRQCLDCNGAQTEEPQTWDPAAFCSEEAPRAVVSIENRTVAIRAWRYEVKGLGGHIVPVYLLDTDLPENTDWDRGSTHHLYGGDGNYRLRQEIVLGMGGVRMAAVLGLKVNAFHMNEGHAALLTLALLEERRGALDHVAESDVREVRDKCVFTTHTPVPAGHDCFFADQTSRILGGSRANFLHNGGFFDGGVLNMTVLALRFSRYANAVSVQHGRVSREMFPAFPVDAITNGVHAPTWMSGAVRTLLDQRIPGWRRDNSFLRNAVCLPAGDIRDAHDRAKANLFAEVASRTGVILDPGALTLGFARRVATYKRAALMLTDPERLARIAQQSGGLQILYAGKAHPRDGPGKDLIRHVFDRAHQLSANQLRIVYLENYDWELGALLTAGVDVWVNTPRRPHEASGTSGMKAAMNGVPSLSVLDGWWIEGYIEGATGWAIESNGSDESEADSLYRKLETVVVPLWADREKWAQLMRSTLAVNGCHFNTDRMMMQYVHNAYYPDKN